MAYFNGQEIGGAVISHHLYEHNIFVKLQNHRGINGIIIKVLSEEKNVFTFNNFLEKIGSSIDEPSSVISTDFTSRYNIIGVFQAENSPNINIIYYGNDIVKLESDACSSSGFKDTVRQIF